MRTVVVGILEREGPEGARQVLVSARSSPAWAAGQWEFPGGRVKDGETEKEALAREWRRALGAEVETGEELYRTSLETAVDTFTLVPLSPCGCGPSRTCRARPRVAPSRGLPPPTCRACACCRATCPSRGCWPGWGVTEP